MGQECDASQLARQSHALTSVKVSAIKGAGPQENKVVSAKDPASTPRGKTDVITL